MSTNVLGGLLWDGDWYLRSSLVNPDPGSPVPPPVPAGPLYQPGVPLYENYAQVLLGMNDLPPGGSERSARAKRCSET